jgi:putative oxidoreductase
MVAHGAQKLFGWFGGHGITGTGGWLESLGFKPGRFHASVTGLAELGGGSLVALGFLTPLGAAAVIGVMVVAIATVHGDNGFFNTAGGFEFNLVLIAAVTALAFTGAGEISIDNALDLGFGGISWGISALAAGLVVAGLVIASRQTVPVADQDQTAGSNEGDEVIDLAAEEDRTTVDAGR